MARAHLLSMATAGMALTAAPMVAVADFDQEPYNHARASVEQYFDAGGDADQDFTGFGLSAGYHLPDRWVEVGPELVGLFDYRNFSDDIDYERFSGTIGTALDGPNVLPDATATRFYVGAGFEYQEFDFDAFSTDDVAPVVRGAVRERYQGLDLQLQGRYVFGDFDYWSLAAEVHYPIARPADLFAGFELWDGDPGFYAGAAYRF